MIKYLNLEIINICNLKCQMCDIWKNKITEKLDVNDINNIINSKYINKSTDITLTWWEPFLNDNIFKIIEKIYDKWLKISTISTNWLIYEKILKTLNYFTNNNLILPNIHISIDWLEKTHDIQRWVEWSFKKSIETIIKLKKIFKNINIKIKYTITKNNINDIKSMYLLSKKLQTDISYKIVENDINYTNLQKAPELLNKEEKKEIVKILIYIYWDNNLYINNLIYYIENKKLKFECTAPINNIFIMANWDTYCCTKNQSIWNIKREKIDDILWNDKHNKIIDNIKKNNCSKCFSFHWSYKSIN